MPETRDSDFRGKLNGSYVMITKMIDIAERGQTWQNIQQLLAEL